MKNVSILGSTGSIGTQTLDVIRRNADINVVALAAVQGFLTLQNRSVSSSHSLYV